jgi:hypothetical protein
MRTQKLGLGDTEGVERAPKVDAVEQYQPSNNLSAKVNLPRRPRGRPTTRTNADYEAKLSRFCRAIRTLDFEVSSRGWCYILEEHGLWKDDFDAAQKLINDCRKQGLLPLNICAEDEARSFDNLEKIDDEDPQAYARGWVVYLSSIHLHYRPLSFWEGQKFYIQELVEKIDLKSLFSPVCAEWYIPIANMGGWADIGIRAEIMRRFAYWEKRGKQCVLLYCGDHDPGGLAISGFLRSNLEDLAGAIGRSPDNLIIDRFGLNADFIETQGLTWIENLATAKGEYPLDDQRHPDHLKPYVQSYLREYGARKVEADALVVRPQAGRELCRQAILRYLKRADVTKYKRKLNAARNEVRRYIEILLNDGGAS